MKQGWKTYRLGDVATMKYGKLPPKNNSGQYPIWSGYRNVGFTDTYNCGKGTIIVVARGVGGTGDVKIAKEDCFLTNLSIAVNLDVNICNPQFFYYKFLLSNLKYLDSGSAQSQITIDDLKRLQISLPGLEEQRRIAGILGAIDDKIENNRRINTNLELQAQALFDEWFVNDSTQPAEYNRASLTDIANYLNGLAMQRFRPQSDEKAIPVLKIKELGQGMCDSSSDICSQSIDSKYIVNDGDIIFSWSGTLLVDIWCGGICGLNQHLFKVTSDKYPKWFVYYWTKYHLAKFIRIAKDKAVTMGHIKRGDLETSEVLIPNAEILSKMDNIIAPIFDAIISRRVENKNLATLRDTLLPKFMNGEIITK